MNSDFPCVDDTRGHVRQRLVVSISVAIIAMSGLCLPDPALATSSETGIWAIFAITDVFQTEDGPSRWNFSFDTQARYVELGSGANQYLVRPGIGYDLGNGRSVGAGYARFRSRNRVGRVADENRYWQQLSWRAGSWGKGAVTMRARLEERSLSTGSDTGLVLRFLTKYTQPIGQDGNRSFFVSLEPFVDLRDTDWGGKSGLGQNRTFIGIGWRLSGKLSIDTGYMNQFIFADSGADRMNHLGIVNFKLKL